MGGAAFLDLLLDEPFDIKESVVVTSQERECEVVTFVYDVEWFSLSDENGAKALVVERITEEN